MMAVGPAVVVIFVGADWIVGSIVVSVMAVLLCVAVVGVVVTAPICLSTIVVVASLAVAVAIVIVSELLLGRHIHLVGWWLELLLDDRWPLCRQHGQLLLHCLHGLHHHYHMLLLPALVCPPAMCAALRACTAAAMSVSDFANSLVAVAPLSTSPLDAYKPYPYSPDSLLTLSRSTSLALKNILTLAYV